MIDKLTDIFYANLRYSGKYVWSNGEVFPLFIGMKIPYWGEIGMGKFLHSSLKAHYIFPIHGLAVMVKINFTIPAKPFLGKI